jgi:ribosomal protein L11 methyltransferase
LVQRFADYRPRLDVTEEHDWVQHAQSMWKPFPVGERFYLVPEWMDDPAPCGRVRLWIRPGLACGSGAHPATQLCLRAMERTVSEGASVLDVGTGSGILAEAAQFLGASPVYACDIDHGAAVVAQRNLAEYPFRPAIFTGSLRSVREGAVDLVVANLNAATLATMNRDLFRVARRTVIVSGFKTSEAQQVSARMQRPVQEQLEEDEWSCLVF